MSAGSGSDTNTYSMVQRVLCGRPPLCAAMSLDFAALGIEGSAWGFVADLFAASSRSSAR